VVSNVSLRLREGEAKRIRWQSGRSFVLATVLAWILVVSGSVVGQAANDDGWSPSVGLFGTLLVNEADGDVSSTVRPSASGEDLFLDPNVGFTAELMTPTIASRSSSKSMSMDVRLVAHTDVAVAFGFERSLAREGDPGAFIFPEVVNAPPAGAVVTPSEVSGRGSYTRAQVQPLLVFAGAGIAIGFEVWDRRVRIKPTIEYRRDEVELRGLVTEVTGSRTVFPDGSINPDFRQIRIDSRDSKYFHSLGPGIEAELETSRVSDFVVSMFVSARAWSVIGDPEIEVRGQCCSSTGPEESARWSYERDRWSYASTVGVRFRWSPKSRSAR
jgi:hypothetical protein